MYLPRFLIFEALLKEKSIKDLGYRNETSIYINESLSFDTNIFLFDVRNKSRTLGYNTIINNRQELELEIYILVCIAFF